MSIFMTRCLHIIVPRLGITLKNNNNYDHNNNNSNNRTQRFNAFIFLLQTLSVLNSFASPLNWTDPMLLAKQYQKNVFHQGPCLLEKNVTNKPQIQNKYGWPFTSQLPSFSSNTGPRCYSLSSAFQPFEPPFTCCQTATVQVAAVRREYNFLSC